VTPDHRQDGYDRSSGARFPYNGISYSHSSRRWALESNRQLLILPDAACMAIELDVADGTYNCRDNVGIELSGFLAMFVILLSSRGKNLPMQVHLRWRYSRFYCDRSGSSSPSR
jgi:hypothetical protein